VIGIQHGPRRHQVVGVLVRVFQGMSSTVSSQVRIQPLSGDWSDDRSSCPTSVSAALRTCSGRSAASTRVR